MQRILALIQAIVSSIRTVMKPVFKAGKWTVQAVTEYGPVVASPVIAAADLGLAVTSAGLRGAARAAEWTVGLPFRAVAGVFAGVGAGGQPQQQAAQAAQQTQEQVQAAAVEAEKALTLQQTARLLMRAAKYRSEGRDISDLVEAIPGGLGRYIRALNTTECLKVSETDTRIVLEWLEGRRAALPGIRTPDQLIAGATPPAQRSDFNFTTAERAELGNLRSRILARKGADHEWAADAHLSVV